MDNEAFVPVTDTPDAGPPPLPNLAVRIAQVFTAPGKLFDALREKPAWLGALLFITVVGLVAQFLVPGEMIRDLIRSQVGPDATAQQVDAAVRIGAITRYVGAVIGPVIVFVIIAGILLLIYNVMLGGEGSFRQVFSATIHANLVGTIGGVAILPLAIARGDLRTALALDLLVPGLEPSGFAFRFLHGLNVFGIWTIVVLGIALSRIYPKVTAGGAIGVLMALYLVLKLILAAVGAG
ncbi:MAG: YIP1 family protein [Gemmatimonadota bacterium]